MLEYKPQVQKEALLPHGKTCKDCVHFNRCAWLIQAKPNQQECDWVPSRFKPIELKVIT